MHITQCNFKSCFLHDETITWCIHVETISWYIHVERKQFQTKIGSIERLPTIIRLLTNYWFKVLDF